jgi:hypothetical protein
VEHKTILDEIFSAVLGEGTRANRWQLRLFEEFKAGQIPDTVKVPAGSGKTAVMLVFMAALHSAGFVFAPASAAAHDFHPEGIRSHPAADDGPSQRERKQ